MNLMIKSIYTYMLGDRDSHWKISGLNQSQIILSEIIHMSRMHAKQMREKWTQGLKSYTLGNYKYLNTLKKKV